MKKIVLLICVLSLVNGEQLQQVLTAINNDERTRVTLLVPSPTTEEGPLSLLSGLSSNTKQRRREIGGTRDEAIVNDNNQELLISYENGTYQNLSLSCPPFQLYDQVDLDPLIVMIITCRDESTVYVLKKQGNGYSVNEHISPPNSQQSSSAAIVTKNGQSTAIYVGPSNHLFHYGLGPDGIELPFNPLDTVLIPCNDWLVESSSESKVVLNCKASGRVFLATGSDGSIEEVTSSINNPDSVVHIYNEHMAVEITSTGVIIFGNDFIDINPITIPSPMVELIRYAYVNDILCLVFFSSSSIYLLNTSNPLTDEFLETLATEDTSIEFNSSYIFIYPPFHSLAYVVKDNEFWTVKTFDLVERIYYPSVTQPWNPLLLDMRVSTITTSTTTTSTITSTASSETAIVESTTITSIISSTPGTVIVTGTSSTPVPSNKVESRLVTAIVIFVVILPVAVVAIIVVSVAVYFLVFKKQKLKNPEPECCIDFPECLPSARSSQPKPETSNYGQEQNDPPGSEERVV